jgi:molybdopterin-binding protein
MRPREVTISPLPGEDGSEAMVRRIVEVGPEVRVELEKVDGTQVRAQLTREQIAELELASGDIVYVRAPGATQRLTPEPASHHC